jgi:carbon-monoxide dehydrogenase large subunit
VGGGFGPKAAGYAEHVIAGKAALTLDRPVKWVPSRSEDMLSLVHGRDYVMTARLGVNNDGKIVGMDSTVLAAGGAYPAIGAILPLLTQMMSVGRVRSAQGSLRRQDGAHQQHHGRRLPRRRTAGGHAADRACARRRRRQDRDGPCRDPAPQLHEADSFPRTTITGANYDSGEYERALDAALKASGYDQLRAEQAARRSSGAVKQLGIGLSTYVEVTAPVGLHIEWGACEVNADGSATVFAGTSVHGQGHATAFAMLASDVLGIPMDKITLVNSDTARVPRGSGTLGIAIAADRGQRHPHRLGRRARSRQEDRRAHARGSTGRHRRRRRRPAGRGVPSKAVTGSNWSPRQTTRRSCPTTSNPAHCVTSSTSTAPTRLSRSVPTCLWSRSTRRPVESPCCDMSLSTTAAASSTRCWSAGNSRRHRPRCRAGVVRRSAVRRGRQPDHGQLDGLRHPVGRRAVQLRDVEHADRQPAQPARSQGDRRVGNDRFHAAIQNAVVDAVSHLGVTHIDMPCTAQRVWAAIQAAR